MPDREAVVYGEGGCFDESHRFNDVDTVFGVSSGVSGADLQQHGVADSGA